MAFRIISFLIICFLLFGCTKFKGEELELNYRDGYVKVLSSEYVIDSLVIDNNADKYYNIGLCDKRKGSNIIYFKNKNPDYITYRDSLFYYCSKAFEINDPALKIFIRKNGFTGNFRGKDFTNIEYFGYNQIPCNSILMDTIEARNPYR